MPKCVCVCVRVYACGVVFFKDTLKLGLGCVFTLSAPSEGLCERV